MYGYSVPSKSFIALALKFRSLINFELMLCIPYMLGVQVHSFAFAYSVVLHQWGRNCSFLIELVSSLLSKINWHRYMDLSLDFQFNFINLCVYARLAPCCCSVSKSHPTHCDPMDNVDCSLPDSSVREISQARILEWVDPRVKPASPSAGGFFTAEPPRKPMLVLHCLDCLVVSFETDMSELYNFVLSLDCFGYLGSFIWVIHFHMNFHSFPYEFPFRIIHFHMNFRISLGHSFPYEF